MKKILMMVLALVMVLSLCACGESGKDATDGTTQAPSVPQTTAPTTPSQNETTESTGADNKSLAISCIDKSVDELYALVGEPNETDYVPSCLMEGEDGMLIYDDFIVYTYRLNGEETVVDVE